MDQRAIETDLQFGSAAAFIANSSEWLPPPSGVCFCRLGEHQDGKPFAKAFGLVGFISNGAKPSILRNSSKCILRV